MLGKYIRVNKGEPLAINNLPLWAQQFEHEDRVVEFTSVPGTPTAPCCNVSTVFLALDHNFTQHGPPILWESMIFTDDLRFDGWQSRYATENKARDGHKELVKMVEIKPFKFAIETHAPLDHEAHHQLREVWARDVDEAKLILESESWAFGIRTLRAYV